MGSIGALGWRKALAPFALLVFILSCQPLVPPEKLVGRGIVQKVVAGDRRVVIAHDDIPGFTREKTQETLYLVAVEKDEGEGPPPASLLPLPRGGKGLG